jgi:DNA-binding PadR family transcriptional regulator
MVLALLLDGPRHGYALKKQAGMLTGQADMHNNLVYPLLRRFVRLGWVRERTAAGERGQTRHIYALTGKGRRALLQRLSEFDGAEAHSAQAFEIRIGLFAFLKPEARREILARRMEHLRAADQRMASLQKAMDLGDYGAEVVRFKRERAVAEMAWIERLARKSMKAPEFPKLRQEKVPQ